MSVLHRPPQPQYVHYTPPGQPHSAPPTTVSPQDTQHAPANAAPKQAVVRPQNAAAGTSSTATQPVVAKGNWTKDLVQLAKTAELKKHALTLQLHTAHILSAHASLEQKNRAIQDIREQRNKLESERARLIECLSQVNEDRNQADLLESSLDRERLALQNKIGALSAGEYAAAKADVDRLRAELGQPPLPGLQETLDGKGAGYLAERRTAGPASNNGPASNPPQSQAPAEKKRKRANANGSGNASPAPGAGAAAGAGPSNGVDERGQAKRPRGRPRGSRNRGAAGG
ncbi:hypothetical protein B0H15DRAFT_842437 [Mycena belliarum]|uniref:Uncharacterized protein n=1 Tax=Mycena belliarum TaxID=1033014 RepID=A0AAD6U7A0_9AGAR|nr:hypothetical protein B0H15DRAFT_842437 [Mycena belliae]